MVVNIENLFQELNCVASYFTDCFLHSKNSHCLNSGLLFQLFLIADCQECRVIAETHQGTAQSLQCSTPCLAQELHLK